MTEFLVPALSGRRRDFVRWAFLAAWAVTVLVLTLSPQPVAVDRVEAAQGPWGARGVADALVNVLLFLPLGLLSARDFRHLKNPVIIGAAFSAAIELTQLIIPGRFPSPWDIGFNTLGAGLGVVLASIAPALRRPGPGARVVLATASLTAALAVLIGGVTLFAPGEASAPLSAAWTPPTRLGHSYGGMVSKAQLGAMPLAPGRTTLREAPMRRLLAGDTLSVTFAAGPPPAVGVPVFQISFGGDQSALTLSVQNTDVVFSYRTRAAALHLDQPDVHLPAALAAVTPGESVVARIWSGPAGHCVQVNVQQECLSPSFGDTWALLLYPVPHSLAKLLRFLWPAVLLLPAGFWLPRAPVAIGLGVVVASSLVLIAPWFAVAHPSVWQLAACPLGLTAGYLLGPAPHRSQP